MPPTASPKVVTFCGRTFSASELELMRQTASEFSALGVTEISRTVCELLEWKRPNGKLKHHECRQLLERLQAEGVLTLPALRNLGGRGPRRVDIRQPCFRPEPLECAVSECEPLELALVEGPAESRLWREQVERYHYLGCRVPFGANLRYWVRNRDRELACLLWTSPAWTMKPRDAWIGWSDEQRQRHLQGIVNNGRFLILPWVRVKGLASKILALSARRMPRDWQTRYGHRPLLGNDRITLPCNDLCAEVAAGRSRRIVGRSEVGRPLIATLPPYRPAFINREGPTTLCNLTVNGLHREVPYARGGSQEKNQSSVAP